MPDEIVETDRARKRIPVRLVFLLLALVSSPLCCWGSSVLLQPFDIFNMPFEVVNRSGETLYITPIDTTPGRSIVIEQPLAFRQRDIPLQPNRSIVMVFNGEYDTLSGIAVCRKNNNCRLAIDRELRIPGGPDQTYGQLPRAVYTLYFFESLPPLDTEIQARIQKYRHYSFDTVIAAVGVSIPLGLYLGWLYEVIRLRFRQRTRGGQSVG